MKLMNVDFSSRSYSTELNLQEAEAERLRKQALQEENAEQLLESERLLQVATETREGFRKAGVPLHQFRVLTGGKSGNLLAMGAYEQQVGRTGKIGLTNLENVAASSPIQDISTEVQATIQHELRHWDSHKNAISRGEDGLIRQHLGDEMNHDLQETMAREGTTKGRDAYDAEEARVNTFASRIGSTRTALTRLLWEGREAKIVEMSQKAEAA